MAMHVVVKVIDWGKVITRWNKFCLVANGCEDVLVGVVCACVRE